MRDILILTDFVNFDPGYSLCHVVQAQVQMLRMMGRDPKLAVRKGFAHEDHFPFTRIEHLDPGPDIDNKVILTSRSEGDVQALERQLARLLTPTTTVITHDIVYQPSAWKYRVAYYRLAKKMPGVRWLHFVHSSTAWDIKPQMGHYAAEVSGQLPNATLAVFSHEELARKAEAFPAAKTAVLPNAIDVLAGLSQPAVQMIEAAGLLEASVAAILPARLDPSKQVDIAAEIMSYVPGGRLLVVDFHSSDATKARVRSGIKKRYPAAFFSSEITGQRFFPRELVLELMSFCDVLIQPSMSEGDSLVVKEAASRGCLLVLNQDLPAFAHAYMGLAIFGKFSSHVDVHTGQPGHTSTQYSDRAGYMRSLAMRILHESHNNKIMAARIKARQQWHLAAQAPAFLAAVEAA